MNKNYIVLLIIENTWHPRKKKMEGFEKINEVKTNFFTLKAKKTRETEYNISKITNNGILLKRLQITEELQSMFL